MHEAAANDLADQPPCGLDQQLVGEAKALSLQIWGKIIGGVAGFAIDGPFGALLGVVAGHVFDHFWAGLHGARAAHRKTEAAAADPRRRDRSTPIFSDPAETRQIAFATALIVLGAKLRKVDGRGHPRRDQDVQTRLPDR